jgi:hypothetical protein
MANFKKTSRYVNGIVVTNSSNQKFLSLRRPLSLEENSGDIFITVTKEISKRPDLIAQKAYGNSELWWVIYEFNGIKDPLSEIKEGTLLRIPALERVLKAIQELGG